MKYFTKEWYELSQKMSADLPLEEDQEAVNFSEEYFNKIYNQKLKEWLNLQEEVAAIRVEHEKANFNNENYEPLDIEKETQNFHRAFLYNQALLKEILPEEILIQIADIRVFTLDKAAPHVKTAVTEFCENVRRLVTRTLTEYRNYYQEASKYFDQEIVQNMNFHDCRIMDIKETEQGLTMWLDNTGGFTNVIQVHFHNYEILKRDSALENAWWLYHEIYRTCDKYELHVLLHNERSESKELIISFESISFI